MNETIEKVAELCGWKVYIDNTIFEFEKMIGTQDLCLPYHTKKRACNHLSFK